MTDLTTVKQGRRDLKEALLDPDMQAVFSALVPRHMTADRMLRLSIACLTRSPKLLEVPQVQVLGALVQCAGIGLEPNSPLQHIHLIPFKNNRMQRYELQTIIGYRGYVELGRRTGRQTWVHGDVVRPGDEFSYGYGNDAHLRHKPGRGSAEREKPTDAYCFVQLADGFAFTVLPEWEILRHRQHSFAWRQDGEKSPWGQHPDRMWRKTAIRVLYSGGEVPLDTELAMAVATDDQRMDYRAMGELALKGGRSAIEHLKEGMDTFVGEEEPESEPEERVVEIRSQVRRSESAPEPHQGPTASPGTETRSGPPTPRSEPPAQAERPSKRGRPPSPKTVAQRIIDEINATDPEQVVGVLQMHEEELDDLPEELRTEVTAAAGERMATPDEEAQQPYDPETGEIKPEGGDGSTDADDEQVWLADAKSTIRGWPAMGHVKTYGPKMLAEAAEWGEDAVAAIREAIADKERRLEQR